MLNLFRTLLPTVLALLIASPLCCCAAAFAGAVEPSCCASSTAPETDSAPQACACPAKDAKDLARDVELPGAIAVPLPAEDADLNHLAPRPVVDIPRTALPRSGCDPPRRRLARLSRWLL